FGSNTDGVGDAHPIILSLQQCLEYYLQQQKDIIARGSQFELNKAEARAHILEGLQVALDHIDAIISLIRNSKTTDIAKAGLMEQYSLTDKQAQAILDMRLQRLTGLEREKIENEYRDLVERIMELKAILADEEKVLAIIREELLEI